MSKTSQRKAQVNRDRNDLYQQGVIDGKAGRGLYWRVHPFINAYRMGHHKGVRDAKESAINAIKEFDKLNKDKQDNNGDA